MPDPFEPFTGTDAHWNLQLMEEFEEGEKFEGKDAYIRLQPDDEPIRMPSAEEMVLVAEDIVYRRKAANDAADAYLDGSRLFFERRGVDDAIVRRRGYAAWTPKCREPLQKEWAPPHIKPSQEGFVTRCAGESAGYVIRRHAPPGLGLSDPSAEIRPFKPIRTDQRKKGAKYVHCPGKGHASRIDMHPDAVRLFEDASRVFFGIEGCIKEDAMLSQGEAVFSVPAVWQWRVPEMAAFVERYLQGKTVFIVPDADWKANPNVCNAAYQCSCYLKGHGLDMVYVAAPPVDENRKPLKDKRGKEMKGVDDFLGAGHSLNELHVVGRDMPPAFLDWAAQIDEQGSNISRTARDVEVLQALSFCSGLSEWEKDGEVIRLEDEGEIHKSLESLQSLINTINPKRRIARKSVKEAIESLAALPGLAGQSQYAITIEGSLEIKERRVLALEKGGKVYGHAHELPVPDAGMPATKIVLDWGKERPKITIAPELLAVDRKRITVGDFMADPTYESWQQFGLRDVSKEGVRKLRRAKVPA